jgi:outer membrane receptor protein involved in Fe transport
LLFATPGAWNSTTRSRSVRVSPKGDQQALYGSLRYRINERIATDVGLRWDKQDLDPRRSDSLAPRIGLSFRLAEHTYIKASWGRFYQSQAINELQVEDGVYEFFRPQRSDHSVLGFEHRFQSGLELRLELYEKTMLELRPRYENLLNSLTLLPELKPDRIRIAPDRARARGAELLLRQRLPSGLGWWAGYSRAQVTDTIAGEVFYRAWDQTHALSTGVNLDTAKWNVSTGLIYRSGWPTTPVTLDDSGPVPIVMTAPRNSERVDFYRSVDIRLTRKFAFERSSLSAYFEVSNVFGRSNPCCTEYEIEPTAADPLELTRLNYLPFVPSLGFVWDF